MAQMTISLVTANNREQIVDCLRSIRDNRDGLDLEIIVVLNASADDSRAVLERDFPDAQLIVNREKLGFTDNHNTNIRRAQGRNVLVLNDDTVILPGALRKMYDYLEAHPEIGILGPRVLNSDGSRQWSCGRSFSHQLEFFRAGVIQSLLRCWPEPHFDRTLEVTWVTGACLLARMAALREVGLFDENIIIYFEDGDLCYRMIRRGWKVVFFPESQIIHYNGQTRKKNLARDLFVLYQSKFYFFAKHFPKMTFLVRAFTIGEVMLRYFRLLLFSGKSGETRQLRVEVGHSYRKIISLACEPRSRLVMGRHNPGR